MRDDAAAIAELLGPIVQAGRYTAMTAPVTEASQREFYETLPERAIFLACVDAGRIVGIQDVLPGAGRSGDISTFVALDRHGQGIGRALFHRTIEEAQRRRYDTLRAVIRSDNPAAIAYYRACGFEGPDTTPQTVLSRPVSCAP